MLTKHTTLLLIGSCLFGSLTLNAQSLQQDTDWLKKQLIELIDKEDAQPVFDFKECLMTMNVDTREEGIRVKVDMSWPLKEIRKVSYKPAENGMYTLLLDMPADKVKGKVKVGIFSKRLREKGEEDSNTSFDLNTKDEKLVQEIQQKFESSIRQCKSEK